MPRTLVLQLEEIRELFHQDPATAKDGGFQNFLVGLQKQVNHSTQEIRLSDEDLENIARYAFDYTHGGWQTRLLTIFERTLGSQLGR